MNTQKFDAMVHDASSYLGQSAFSCMTYSQVYEDGWGDGMDWGVNHAEPEPDPAHNPADMPRGYVLFTESISNEPVYMDSYAIDVVRSSGDINNSTNLILTSGVYRAVNETPEQVVAAIARAQRDAE